MDINERTYDVKSLGGLQFKEKKNYNLEILCA